jgi:hypothetical protein
MTVPILEATSFLRKMPSGRTTPCLFLCESDNHEENNEYIVKLKSCFESGIIGLSSELIASLLASFFDLQTPSPALIKIDPILAEAIHDSDLKLKIRNSIGLNFGSSFLSGGYETWPIGKSIPVALRPSAAEIFAFDALIQNPDRRSEKPNVLWKGDLIYIIDHELGFSFIYDIFQKPNPWKISELVFLRSHLFYNKLKGQSNNFDRFAGALEALSPDKLGQITSSVPDEWKPGKINLIEQHLLEISRHANDFIDELRRILL